MSNTTALPTYTVRYMDMTADELRDAYWAWRKASYQWSQLACSTSPRSAAGRRVASGWGRCVRAVELIENVARKRNVSLAG